MRGKRITSENIDRVITTPLHPLLVKPANTVVGRVMVRKHHPMFVPRLAPAFRNQCRNCRRRGRFATVCRQRLTANHAATVGTGANPERDKPAAFDDLCGVTTDPPKHVALADSAPQTEAVPCSEVLDHHTYDDHAQRWRR